jgi:hypothetical protein
MLVTALVVGGMCALLGLNTAAAANEVARHNLALRDAGVAAQVQQLRNEVAASAAPGALGSAAQALGMIPAGNPAFLQIEPDGSVRVLGSPAPASELSQPQSGTVKPHNTPKTTPPAKPTGTSTATGAAKAGTATPTAAKPTGAATAHPSPTPTQAPTPTPTPTTTLPGGTR